MADNPGQVNERFRAIERLGEGSTATVWLCEDRLDGSQCAMKVLHPAFAVRSSARVRFALEARAMKQIRHRHVIAFIEAGQQGDPYIAMEVAPMGTVAMRLQQVGFFSPAEASTLVVQACKGVSAAHAVGVIHRDLRPASLLLGRKGLCKVSDFGGARVRGSGSITEAGTPIGGVAFRPPEQRSDARYADVRSDVYSLGATLFNLVTGRLPPDLFAVHHDPEMLAALPAPFAEVIRQATRFHPHERYPTVVDFARALHDARLALGADDLDPVTSTDEIARPNA